MIGLIITGILAAVVFGVVLVGRGSGSPAASAATKTADAGSARVSLSIALRSPKLSAGQMVRIHGSGALDKTGADVTVNLGPLATAANAPKVPSSVHAILSSQGGDEVAFIHATPMPSFTGGKDWVEVDLSTLASSHGVDLAALAAGAAVETPTQLLDLARSAGATVTDLGPATVAGASTTHYRLVVDPTQVAQIAGLPTKLTSQLGRHGTAKVPVNVWIGRTDGLVHRVTLVLRNGAAHASIAASFRDFGASVSISPPPASDVFDATGLLSMLGA
jgi:hypothetical protein